MRFVVTVAAELADGPDQKGAFVALVWIVAADAVAGFNRRVAVRSALGNAGMA